VPRYRYSTPHGGNRSERSLSTARVVHGLGPRYLRLPVLRATGSHVPHESQSQAHATSMPDTTWPVNRSPPGSIPGSNTHPGFDVIFTCFDTSTVVHSRSSSWLAPDPIFVGPCPQRSPPRLLTDAACGGLTPPPAERRRRATPPSLAQLHTFRESRSSTSLPSCARGTRGFRLRPGLGPESRCNGELADDAGVVAEVEPAHAEVAGIAWEDPGEGDRFGRSGRSCGWRTPAIRPRRSIGGCGSTRRGPRAVPGGQDRRSRPATSRWRPWPVNPRPRCRMGGVTPRPS
jgi:hypothetical protein